MESYANSLWRKLQNVSDQDSFMGGQKPTIAIENEAGLNNVKKSEFEDQMLQLIRLVKVDTEDVLQDQPHKQPCSKTDDYMVKMVIKTTTIVDDGGLHERNLNKSTTESEYSVYDSEWKLETLHGKSDERGYSRSTEY
jgi:hypothetical protein